MSRGGLRAALGHGAVAFSIPLLFGQLLALLRAAGPLDPTAWDVLRAGALAPSFVHRVPVEVRLLDVSGPGGLFGGPFEVGFTVRVALLLATAGAGWVLVRGGRAGGGPREGLLVAATYTLLSALAALLARGSDPAILLGAGFAGLGETEAAPSLGWAAALPAALAAGCGAAGGLSARRRADGTGTLRAVLGGAWRMTWLLAAGGTAGVLVVVALHPDATRAFLDALGARGWAGAAAVLLVTILLMPNVGIGAGVAAMGIPIVVRAGGSTCALISLGGTPCGDLSVDVSPAHFLFVLVPVAATTGGGWWAARRLGRTTTAARAAAVGAAAGAVFAPALVALSFMASVAYRLTGPLADALGEGSVAVGPRPMAVLLWAVPWGIAGGAVGALAASVRGTGPGDGPGPNVSRVRRYAAGGGGGPATLLSWKRR